MTDADDLAEWIGRKDSAEEVLSHRLATRYHMTFERPGDPPAPGAAAPRLIHWCLAQPVAPMSALGEDGHPALGTFLPPVPLPRRMWAGGEVTFHGDLRVGDRVCRTSRIADIARKEGRSGTLWFVTVAHEITVAGQTRVTERQDLVYRAAGGAGGAAPAAAPPGKHRRRVEPSSTLLFRYSAMTFNGHRIHYDRDHAVRSEGYDGLVVHGPMQAALLLMFAGDLAGRAPDRLSFRGMSPLTDTGGAFHLNAAQVEDGRQALWTARDGGPEAMRAEAGWAEGARAVLR
ncbi:FAS1-like dehydratase domain-containing protein [Roseivivax sediminis]|uniref:3-methylfumaryl-CoA hydratase n=1 Tax=Roseivivax sediminis TaxID=936889 RepID=A0A1I1SIQ8_9RHOB|nr:MaoC family dehydratase N-terminal domain-containing protein [Roseivivax sediminis]SFD44538.1 3-methylfumaryl-CoA hydratase [Roseivivax sediminis]